MKAVLSVIFDLDGLLADTEPLWTESARRLLARRGLRYDPAMKARTLGRHPLEVMGIYKERYHLTEEPDVLVAERLALLREIYQTSLRLMPGAEALVRALSDEGVPMAVASSSPSTLVGWVLGQLGLHPPIAVWVGSDQVQHGKPAPDLFLLAAAALEAAPDRCVVLEDSPAGLMAARAAGMCCVAVPGPEAPAPLPPCDLLVCSLLELTPDRLRSMILPPRHEESS